MTAKIDAMFPVGSVVRKENRWGATYENMRCVVLGREKFSRSVKALIINAMTGYEENHYWGFGHVIEIGADGSWVVVEDPAEIAVAQ